MRFGRTDHRLQPDAGTGFVDHVNRLVRQAPCCDVPAGEIDRRFQGIIGDLHAMVRFVAVAKAAENVHGLGLRGRIDIDFLEPAFQGAVFLDVFAVLIQRGRADALEFAPAERGF